MVAECGTGVGVDPEPVLASLALMTTWHHVYWILGQLDHLRGGAAVHPGAGEGDKLVTSLMDHEPAHLALVALLPEPPGNSGILLDFSFSTVF